jgi:hypothetical protein
MLVDWTTCLTVIFHADKYYCATIQLPKCVELLEGSGMCVTDALLQMNRGS